VSKPRNGIAELHPAMRPFVARIEGALQASGLAFIRYETLRNRDRQEAGFRRGVSKARMWQSYHNFGLAADFVGKGPEPWDPKRPWRALGAIIERSGCTWGGRFHQLFDGPHAQHATLRCSGAIATPSLCGGVEPWREWSRLFVGLMDLSIPADAFVLTQAVQATLNELGAGLRVDGALGPKTRAAAEAVGANARDWESIIAAVSAREGE